MSKPTILFNDASANSDSPVFALDTQKTVVGIGLQADDIVTFEVISIAAGARADVCGCRLTPALAAQVTGVQQLTCAVCKSGDLRPIQLTQRNPVVVLDVPEGALLRAIYSHQSEDPNYQSGLDLRTATVSLYESHTRSVTDEMRGCPPICCEDEEQTWTPTGLHRCTETVVEIEEVSNCGHKRWVECGEVVWQDTGTRRCFEGGYWMHERNQCGYTRWTEIGEEEWVDTGALRCGDASVESQQTNQCGQTRWFDTGDDVAWVETGITRCVEGSRVVQETNQCGGLRWTATEESCAVVVVGEDCGLTGDGSPGNPLCIDNAGGVVVGGEGCALNGDGTEGNPLCIDIDELTTILNENQNTQIVVGAECGLTGDGTADNPLCIDGVPGTVETSDTSTIDFSGDGSPGTPLQAVARISTNAGNLLRATSGGLLVTLEAPADSLYVSSSTGDDDTGDGTSALPYKTIRKALSLVPNFTSATIHLKAGDTFDLLGEFGLAAGASYNGARNFSVQQRRLVIDWYDDPLVPPRGSFPAGTYPYAAVELQRPKLLTSWYEYTSAGLNYVARFVVGAGGSLDIYGCEIGGMPGQPDPGTNGLSYGNGYILGSEGSSSIVLWGCKMSDPHIGIAYVRVTSGGSFGWLNTVGEGSQEYDGSGSYSIQINGAGSAARQADYSPAGSGLTTQDSSTWDAVLEASGAIAGLVCGSGGPRNLITNLDICV